MDRVQKEFEIWRDNVEGEYLDQLLALQDDPEELHDSFYRDLSFGTAGLRGVLGMGPNRMNFYTVAKATQGFADYLVANFDDPCIAIARDSRHQGALFVETAARVMAGNGVRAFVFNAVEPTPVLSFAVRDLKCSGGINVTASHNPSQYNGYKAYGPDGCQIKSQAASDIQDAIDALGYFEGIKLADYAQACSEGMIEVLDDSVVDRFLDAVYAQSVEPESFADNPLSIVYTPLNGTGLPCVMDILNRVGFKDIRVVTDQGMPDGAFATCPYPNPEEKAALERGLELAELTGADLLLATDPDADRVGIAVRHDGSYELLNGNEVGNLLIDYICKMRELRGEDLGEKLVVTTIVSTLMPDALASKYGFELRRVLTGFKYIGGQIAMLEEAGEDERFMFGFEESYGYMSGTHVRDKDAINASMLICQMARWHKSMGHDLYEAMEELYAEHGYYLNRTLNFSYPGSDGAEKMASIMEQLRVNPPTSLVDMPVVEFTDFSKGAPMPTCNSEESQQLPAANVVSFKLGDGVQILVRPSGTEPKIKAYLFACGETRESAVSQLEMLAECATGLLG